jgi:hypothetical protein
MYDKKLCSECQEPMYASYKKVYYCVKHLKEHLQEEEKLPIFPRDKL